VVNAELPFNCIAALPDASMPNTARSICANAQLAAIPAGFVQNDPMEPNWDDLKVLLALARGGSVAGAARELKVDHSTVSRRLAAMEQGFGAQLLVRGGRAYTTLAPTTVHSPGPSYVRY
jgi:hypothetical protein